MTLGAPLFVVLLNRVSYIHSKKLPSLRSVVTISRENSSTGTSRMNKRQLKLNKDKNKIMVVGNPLQIRKIDLPSNLKMDQPDIN